MCPRARRRTRWRRSRTPAVWYCCVARDTTASTTATATATTTTATDTAASYYYCNYYHCFGYCYCYCYCTATATATQVVEKTTQVADGPDEGMSQVACVRGPHLALAPHVRAQAHTRAHARTGGADIAARLNARLRRHCHVQFRAASHQADGVRNARAGGARPLLRRPHLDAQRQQRHRLGAGLGGGRRGSVPPRVAGPEKSACDKMNEQPMCAITILKTIEKSFAER